MPAISHQEFQAGAASLQAREWRNTVGQSGMTPTAFAFLVPVFVVAIAAPFLCVFCIRKRRRNVPPIRPVKTKKPALPRTEARDILGTVTDISHLTSEKDQSIAGHIEDRAVETRSVVERECAICLSALFAPSPPEPVKLAHEMPTDETPTALPAPSVKDLAPSEPEAILKLQVCSHEFHAECLVSWFALRKTSCPICRAVFFSKEAMQSRDDEAQLAEQEAAPPPAPEPAPVVSNWRYFLYGRNVFRNQNPNPPTPATPMTTQPSQA